MLNICNLKAIQKKIWIAILIMDIKIQRWKKKFILHQENW